MKKVVIIGATSAIALCGRNLERLETVKADIISRYKTEILIKEFDVCDFNNMRSNIDSIINQFSGIDILLIAHGLLPDQAESQNSVEKIIENMNVNANSVMAICSIVAEKMEEQGNGTIAVISSVAGDRGRQSNYIYGSAKAAVSSFLQGLRNRLYHNGVHVLTIKPGFVDTPMTAHLEKNFLFAKADSIAQGIMEAIEAKKDVVYLPKFWALIMWIVKHIPESIFKKLKM
jgi:short-subunit dehydrogenase